MLKVGDNVGIVACSNGLDKSAELKIDNLKNTLKSIGINTVNSSKLYKEYSIFNGNAKEKAQCLMDMYRDKNIKAIFDVSGGDLANSILGDLDFEEIKDNYKPFFGYSDLTVIVNALYTKTDKKTYLYQIRNLINENKEIQNKNFKDTLIRGTNNSLFDFKYDWIQGEFMDGIVVGGNIRCLLKLAGTEYMPDFRDKILFLEAFTGDVAKIYTFLNQYKMLKVFEKINGVILGTFTEMERENYYPTIIEMVKEIAGKDMPIIKTDAIGHGSNSKCIVIGERLSFRKS